MRNIGIFEVVIDIMNFVKQVQSDVFQTFEKFFFFLKNFVHKNRKIVAIMVV